MARPRLPPLTMVPTTGVLKPFLNTVPLTKMFVFPIPTTFPFLVYKGNHVDQIQGWPAAHPLKGF